MTTTKRKQGQGQDLTQYCPNCKREVVHDDQTEFDQVAGLCWDCSMEGR